MIYIDSHYNLKIDIIMKRKVLSILLLACGIFGFTAAVSAQTAGINWIPSYSDAVEKAKAENKPLFILFTGSDWCPYCIYLERDVLSKEAFKKYAADNLIMVIADFPRGIQQNAEVIEQNKTLQRQFGVRGFPTVVLVNVENNRQARLGYERDITPEIFNDKIQAFKVESGLAK